MSHPPTFAEAVDVVDELSLDDQEALLQLLKRRLLEKRRADLVARVREAEQELRDGKGRELTADQIVDELLEP
jgi:hypothetical protein